MVLFQLIMNASVQALFVVVFCAIAIQQSLGAECSINPFGQTPSPLVIRNGETELVYPEYNQRRLNFQLNDVIELACPGSHIIVSGKAKSSLVKFRCVSGDTLMVDNSRVSWRDISCQKDPEASVRTSPGTISASCAILNGKEIEIGFKLDSRRFIKTIKICFDHNIQSPIFSEFMLSSSIQSRPVGTPRPLWVQPSGFYQLGSLTMDKLYGRRVQRAAVNSMLGLSKTDLTYVKNDVEYFLGRGHLVANADFIYPAQSFTTFNYINSAPQWQIFNGKNWEAVESSVRRYANRKRSNLRIWTGVYGVSTLPHVRTGQQTKLFLYTDNNNNKAVPVPNIFWKVVYDPFRKLGIALIGVNNPFNVDVTKDVICNDISNKISWVSWDRTNAKEGYSYACTIPDLKRVVAAVPNIEVSGLLV